MANEWDRRVMPEFLQSAFAIWLGAAYRSFEMMKSPVESMSSFVAEAKSLLTVPSDAGEDLRSKAEAVASVWMEKGAKWMEELKSTGQRFTDAQ